MSKIAVQLNNGYGSVSVGEVGGSGWVVSPTGQVIKQIDETDKIDETINHPKHYTTGSIEPINVIHDWKLGFWLGNTVKYIARAEHKGTLVQDLKKARWYLDDYIKRLEAGEDPK